MKYRNLLGEKNELEFFVEPHDNVYLMVIVTGIWLLFVKF